MSPTLPMGILEPGTGSKDDGGVDGIVDGVVVAAVAPGKTRLLKVREVGISFIGFIFAGLGTGNDRLPEPGCTAIGTINSDGNAAIVEGATLVFIAELRLLVDATSGRVKVNSWGELERVGLAIDTGIVAGGRLLTKGRLIPGVAFRAIGLATGMAAMGIVAVCIGGTDRTSCLDC